jgi:hypothetical protein
MAKGLLKLFKSGGRSKGRRPSIYADIMFEKETE